jgi:isopentenyl diphosphate isomerase/L-lactate dehydrogenase-like FMN-dependent dehydrogenase
MQPSESIAPTQPTPPISVFDYEALAQARLHPSAWDYFAAGAGDEITLRENRAAFERIRLRPRVLVDVSHVEMSTTLLGTAVAMPIGVAPSAMHGAACDAGECATAAAAGALGTLMVASTESTRTLEEIARDATGPLWFQLYFASSKRGPAERLVRRAEVAGYRALVLTVDSPRWGQKERHMRSEATYTWPASGNFTQEAGAADAADTLGDDGAALTWADVDWLQSRTALPLILKGILTAEDAALAVAHGVAGIVVSNHGGRQLDSVPATIEALPEVVAAVAGRCEVYVDGGIRRGTDVLKALALGARAVLVGRPILWGLAVTGEAGARHVLALLRAELEGAMALAGCPTLASIDRSLVRLPSETPS